MKHFFYLLAFLPLMWEIMVVLNPSKVHAFVKGVKSVKDKKYTDNQNIYIYFNMFYLLWALIGLLSFQWPVFLFFLITSFIPKTWIVWRWIDAVMGVILLLFIILNAYHFQIDVWALIRDYMTS